MSVETMSTGSAVGAGTAINTGPIALSFGEKFSGGIKNSASFGIAPDLGGTHMTGFDNLALSETFQMPAPSLNSPQGGKVIHDISPFANTQILWKAQNPISEPTPIQINKVLEEILIGTAPTNDLNLSSRVISQINEISDIPQSLDDQSTILSEPEVKLPPQTGIASNLDLRIESFIQETFLEPDTKIGKAIPVQTEQQEITADALQAVKVEEALMAVGSTEEEAHKVALRIFTETENKKGLTPTVKKELNIVEDKIKPPELHFEHDANADEARKKAATKALDDVTGEKDIVTGHDIAEHMPGPKPEVNSEIAKDKDGSYASLIKQLESIGEISSEAEVINRVVSDNHAVRTANVLTTPKATEQEIKKVLGGKEIVIFQK